MGMCDILNVTFIQKHIVPIAFHLVQDRVAQVRETAARLVRLLLYFTTFTFELANPVCLYSH